jgi:hypothetical protein
MKNQLIFGTLAVGFLAGLGIAAVRGELWHAPAALVQEPPEQVAAMPLQAVAVGPVMPAPATGASLSLPLEPAAVEPAASDPQPEGGESADPLPAPTYDDETAARDRAAAHSARSR